MVAIFDDANENRVLLATFDWQSAQVEIGMENSLEEAKSSATANPIPKIRIIQDEEATGETARAYEFWRSRSGRQKVPEIIKCFGARPDFLRQVVEFSNTVHFSEGHLTRRHKEMLAAYVSYLNRCPF